MLSGEPYSPNAGQLVTERQAVKELLYDLNRLRPTEHAKKKELFQKLLGKTERSFYIELPFRCDYGSNITLGSHFFANYNLVILDSAKVTIGDHVFMGPDVGIYTAAHPVDAGLRNRHFEYALPITIGNNVWIGGHVVINPGVSIGDNSVIGSGSVVTSNIPANVVAAGNPCKVIRAITQEDSEQYYKSFPVQPSPSV